jgi:peptidoglycan/LPS O-acetylase OafA/YrhL
MESLILGVIAVGAFAFGYFILAYRYGEHPNDGGLWAWIWPLVLVPFWLINDRGPDDMPPDIGGALLRGLLFAGGPMFLGNAIGRWRRLRAIARGDE